jgi:hypothetical protein
MEELLEEEEYFELELLEIEDADEEKDELLGVGQTCVAPQGDNS